MTAVLDPTATAVGLRRAKRVTASRRAGLIAFCCLLPALAVLVAVRLLPFGWAIKESISNSHGNLVGGENYRFLARSVTIGSTIRATLVFTAATVAALTLVSIVVAIIFTQPIPFASVTRALVFAPIAVPLSGSAIFWSVAFRPDGLANSFLASFGVGAQPFLSSASQAMPALVLMLVWISVGYGMIFLIAGLNEIPEELYEAAATDGATWWRRTVHVTFPGIRRQLLFVVVSNTAGAFAAFAPVSILTHGGPSGSTNLVMWDVFQRAYIEQDMPAAMAETVIVTVVMIVIVTWQFRLLRSD